MLHSDLPQRFGTDSTSSDERPTSTSRISVIVVATERLFRLGLARLLGEDERLDVIGVSDGDDQLLGLLRHTPVDVVLMDIELAQTDGIDLVRDIASECPSTKTLVLTSNVDWKVRPVMIAGAAGLLLKDASPEAIRAAVVSVHLGDQVLCAEAAQRVLGEEPSPRLTQRESDVLRMVAHGASNAEIALHLQLGQKTVRNYVSRVCRKLALSNRAQMSAYLAHGDMGRPSGSARLTLADQSLVSRQ